MQVIVKDERELYKILLEESYTLEQIEAAKQTIGKIFEEAAMKIYAEILEKPLPKTILVSLAPTHPQMQDYVASFHSRQSRSRSLAFTVYEKTVKEVLSQCDEVEYKSTILHEMMHAADLPLLLKGHRLLDELQKEIHRKAKQSKDKDGDIALVALLDTLRMFEHYRTEGVAILGEHLITRRRFHAVFDTLEDFLMTFEWTMMKSKKWAVGETRMGEIFDDVTFDGAYRMAPTILLLVLARRGDVEKDLAKRVLWGLHDGVYEITDEEAASIIRSTLSLTVSEYIRGVVSLGDKVAPAKPFLEFCVRLSDKSWNDDSIEAFSEILQHPTTAESFNEALEQFMGHTMEEAEIDVHYQAFVENTRIEALCPGIKEKAARLYDELKNGSDTKKKQTAGWALTYLFEDKDIISDNIQVIGYVDDMAVVDHALDIIVSAS